MQVEVKERDSWDEYFMGLANKVRERSKDRATKIGSVIVGPDREIRSTGYNSFPRGINDDVDERHERPAKYWYTPHSELNSICNAAMMGTPTKGCTIYVTTRPPCATCAGAIINAGIVEVVVETVNASKRPDGDSWEAQTKAALEMFEEAGVIVRRVNECPDKNT